MKNTLDNGPSPTNIGYKSNPIVTNLSSFKSIFDKTGCLLIYFFFFAYLPSPNLGLTLPGTYKPNALGSDACRGSNSLWTRTLDRYTRAGLPECVVSTMSGPPPKTTQDGTKTKDTHTQSQDRK